MAEGALARPCGKLGTDVSNKMNDTNAFITERTIEALAPKTGESIIELGPGNGVLSCGLVQVLIQLHAGDCHDVAVDVASIDGLMAVNVLYFVDDLDRLLARIRPWFRPGGRCVFGIRPAATLRSLCFHEFGYHIRLVEEIENTMRTHGFGQITHTHFDEGEGSPGELSFPNGSIIIKAIA
ncbi:methyltransferase domain-containing protein [Photobacterium sp. SDRW27]|uniref:class I SAM-dependent methyltransferase n=1 Tax=Photobacterium obscurum TaxID=2829490 RepID=UPI0022440272|nr:methyltransferase domain-containing protein [Photobacterium obscurum]MCW8331897.1 methyltransferase domain-containing protein [Photobacterium obscurum]